MRIGVLRQEDEVRRIRKCGIEKNDEGKSNTV